MKSDAPARNRRKGLHWLPFLPLHSPLFSPLPSDLFGPLCETLALPRQKDGVVGIAPGFFPAGFVAEVEVNVGAAGKKNRVGLGRREKTPPVPFATEKVIDAPVGF